MDLKDAKLSALHLFLGQLTINSAALSFSLKLLKLPNFHQIIMVT